MANPVPSTHVVTELYESENRLSDVLAQQDPCAYRGALMDHFADTLTPLFARYMADQPQYSDSTVSTYCGDARAFLRWCAAADLDFRDMDDIDRTVFSEYVIHLSPNAPARSFGPKPRRLRWSTLRRKKSALRAFYHFLTQQGWFDFMPVPSGRSTEHRSPEPLPSFLTLRQMKRLLDACDPSSPLRLRDRAILEVTYASGLQLAEVHGLDVGHVQLGESTLTIVGNPGRAVPFGRHALRYLSRYLTEVRPGLVKTDEPAALWLNSRATRLSRKAIGSIVKKYAEAAGLAGTVTPNALRHSCAAHLLDGEADIAVVGKMLGHESLLTTERYGEIAVERNRERYLACHPMAKGTQDPEPSKPRHDPELYASAEDWKFRRSRRSSQK